MLGLVDPAEYRRLDLRAHRLLEDVPLHDVWAVDLPGGGPGRTVADVRAFFSYETVAGIHPLVRLLFTVRGWLGRVFGWDEDPTVTMSEQAQRLSDEDQTRSVAAAGEHDGPFSVLYVHPSESAQEIRNRTVHAFLVLALIERGEGYRLYWAVYVAPVGAVTKFYMALIDPFRRWIVYPTILRHVRAGWVEKFGETRGGGR